MPLIHLDDANYTNFTDNLAITVSDWITFGACGPEGGSPCGSFPPEPWYQKYVYEDGYSLKFPSESLPSVIGDNATPISFTPYDGDMIYIRGDGSVASIIYRDLLESELPPDELSLGQSFTINNNLYYVDYIQSIRPSAPVEADLGLTMSVSEPDEFGEFVYTIELTNYGPNNASNVYIYGDLPFEVLSYTYYDFDESRGYYDPSVLEWYVENIAVGETVSIDIAYRNPSGSSVTYRNVIFSLDQDDLNALNDEASISLGSELTVSLDFDEGVNPDAIFVGDNVPILARVDNTGDANTDGDVILTIEVPDGLKPKEISIDGILQDILDYVLYLLDLGPQPVDPIPGEGEVEIYTDENKENSFIRYNLGILQANSQNEFLIDLVIRADDAGDYIISGSLSEELEQQIPALQALSLEQETQQQTLMNPPQQLNSIWSTGLLFQVNTPTPTLEYAYVSCRSNELIWGTSTDVYDSNGFLVLEEGVRLRDSIDGPEKARLLPSTKVKLISSAGSSNNFDYHNVELLAGEGVVQGGNYIIPTTSFVGVVATSFNDRALLKPIPSANSETDCPDDYEADPNNQLGNGLPNNKSLYMLPPDQQITRYIDFATIVQPAASLETLETLIKLETVESLILSGVYQLDVLEDIQTCGNAGLNNNAQQMNGWNDLNSCGRSILNRAIYDHQNLYNDVIYIEAAQALVPPMFLKMILLQESQLLPTSLNDVGEDGSSIYVVSVGQVTLPTLTTLRGINPNYSLNTLLASLEFTPVELNITNEQSFETANQISLQLDGCLDGFFPPSCNGNISEDEIQRGIRLAAYVLKYISEERLDFDLVARGNLLLCSQPDVQGTCLTSYQLQQLRLLWVSDDNIVNYWQNLPAYKNFSRWEFVSASYNAGSESGLQSFIYQTVINGISDDTDTLEANEFSWQAALLLQMFQGVSLEEPRKYVCGVMNAIPTYNRICNYTSPINEATQ